MNHELPDLAFVGLGWIGGLRLEAVRDAGTARVVAICDRDERRLTDLGRRFPGAFGHRDLDAILEVAMERRLDGVVLATPNALHAPQAHACLERDLALFVQKPLGVSPAEVESVLVRARREDRLVDVDYSYRQLHSARRLRELVHEGTLGDVYLVEAIFHNAYGPDKAWCFDSDLAGGGALLDLGVHLLDLVFWIFGPSSPRGLRGWMREMDGHPGIDRFTSAEMTLDPNLHVRMTSSWHAHTGCDCDFRLILHGPAASAELRNQDGGFYDFELVLRTGRTEEVLVTDSRTWMDRGILAWIGRVAAGRGFDPTVETSLAVAAAVDELYAHARA